MRALAQLALLAALLASGRAEAAGDPVADAAGEVQRAETARAEAESRLAAASRKNRDDATEIERLKAVPASVTRDYRLGQLLAAVQERSGELDRLQGELRSLDGTLSARRRALLVACDRALEDPKLPDARRVELVRRREVESDRLATGSVAVVVAKPAVDPLDGAGELGEKADLLKDREERLRREVDRLGRRIDGVESRRHLRERAGAVDEDVFMESGTGRQVVRVVTPTAADRTQKTAGGQFDSNGMGATAGGTPAPAVPGAGGPPTGESSDRTGVSLRGVIDPTTLDELRRAEAGSDLDAQLRALRRMQTGLRSLAEDLGRREADLRKRAREIKPRK